MCGIAGIVGEGAGAPPDRAHLTCMLAAIAHRGQPEHFGQLVAVPGAALGCNRLAIVDRAQAAQPMSMPERGLWVAYNGEIYNFADLRRQLSRRGHTFHTLSDTEVLLHGYAEWGDELPGRLDGMFAFVVYDEQRRSFLCARDHIGIKPLYFARDGGRLYLGSELKCFRAVGLTPDVFPAGHLMRDGRLVRYYDHVGPRQTGQPGELVRRYRELLEEAVRKRVATDLPVGVLFSGGIDSAAVLALATRHHGNVTAFSVGFPGAPDLEIAQRYCRERGIPHVVRTLELRDLERALPTIVEAAETFEAVDIMDASVMAPAFQLAREAGIRIVLCGDGSDELLAGYDLFREHADPEALMAYRVGNLHRTDLQRVDRASMLHTVEARVPFMDRDLIPYAFGLPMDVKIRDGVEKWILREAVADVLPDYLTWRPKVRMPEGVGLRYQLLEHAREQHADVDPDLLRALCIDQPEGAYLLSLYLQQGFPAPSARYKREGWDFSPGGYFRFGPAAVERAPTTTRA